MSFPLPSLTALARKGREKGLSFDLDFTLSGSFSASMFQGLSNFGPRLTVGNSLQNNPRYVCSPAFIYSIHITVAHINIYVFFGGGQKILAVKYL